MPEGMPKLRFWQSRGKTLKVAELGFDALKILTKAKEPMTVSDMMKIMGRGRNSVTSGYVVNALIVLHKVGAVEGDDKVTKLRVAGDLTKISITKYGRELANQSKSRTEFARRLLERR